MTQENDLDELLSMATIRDIPDGFSERIAFKSTAFAQKKNATFRAWELLTDMLHDIFGSPADIPLYNAKWRTAGAFAALLLGFSVGYYTSVTGSDEDNIVAGVYAVDETEGVDAI